MGLREKINEEIKKAMQEKNELLLLVLRGVNATIHNREIEKRTKLSKTEKNIKKLEEQSKLNEEEELEAVASEAKKRKEAIIEFSAYGGSASGGEKEKIDNAINKEKLELEILKKYLPEQMSEEEIREEVKKVIEEVGAVGPRDTGKVMAVVMPRLKGKAEGGAVSKILGELL
jgi:hypothetical protein